MEFLAHKTHIKIYLVRLLIKQGDLGRVLSTGEYSFIQKTFSHCQTPSPCAIKINTESVHKSAWRHSQGIYRAQIPAQMSSYV